MGIIEQIDIFLSQKTYITRMPYARGSTTREIDPAVRGLLARAAVRLRDLERALDKSGYPEWPAESEGPPVNDVDRVLEKGHVASGPDFRWAPNPRGEATAPSTIERYLELARRVEALENPDTTRWGSYVEGYVRPLAQRIEALEAREEARGGARAAEEVRRPMPKAQPTCPGAREFRSDLDDDMRYENGAE
jgi:hypothetical protein